MAAGLNIACSWLAASWWLAGGWLTAGSRLAGGCLEARCWRLAGYFLYFFFTLTEVSKDLYISIKFYK